MKQKTVPRRNVPWIVAAAACVLAAAAAVYWNRSRPAWLVERGLETQWAELLASASPPPPFTRILVHDPAVPVRKRLSGVIISKHFPEGEADSVTEGSAEDARQPPVRIFPGLYQGRGDYRGAVPLALDPWLVFRKTGDPPLSLERVLESEGGPGFLILPGAEGDAVRAWTAQLLQQSPGSFPAERQVWDEAEQRLVYGNRRFQQGALTSAWLDAWLSLLGSETAWVYAPLSRTRGLSSYDAGRLDAAIFPIHADWNTYGLQADILWAVPAAPEKPDATIDAAQSWLANPETQTLIADILGWIPAHSGGRPRDTLARQAQVAWFSSSFVWQR